MRDNQFTPFEEDEPEYETAGGSNQKSQKKGGAAKTKTKKTASGERTSIIDFIKSKRFLSSIGALLTLFSLFLFFACISYFFTWKHDQDALTEIGFWEYISSYNIPKPNNWLGKLGAWFSHALIHNAFGIVALGFSLLLFLFGVKLSLGKALLPLGKTTLIVFVYTLWGSSFLGFFNPYLNFAGGTFGFAINHWLFFSIGQIPTFLLHLVTLYMVTTLLFNPNYSALLQLFKSKTELNDALAQDHSINDMRVVNPIQENQIEEDVISETIHFDEDPIEDNRFEPDNPFIHSELDVLYPLEYEQDPEADATEEIPPIPLTESTVGLADELVEKHGLYDPKQDLDSYVLPPIDLLTEYKGSGNSVTMEELESNKVRIVETLSNYKIAIAKIKATVGPTVTLYEIIPAPGVRIAKIKNLEDDIALSLSALGIRIIAPIPGKGTIGIEVPNSNPEKVSMRSLIASDKFQNHDGELPIVMGKTITNETFVFDLTKMPHLLVAGATGQGKSVGLNAILVSLLYKKHPAQVKFVLVDPKKVELTLYNKIERHFLAKLPGEEDAIIVDTSKVVNTLNSLCIEMDDRYELLKEAGVRTIKEYNTKFIARKLNPEKGHRYLPYIVVLIDEFADLIMTAGKEVEHPIARIAQLARAIGIHLIVATQRPSVNVITGMIKANFPARIAFRVLSKIDSRTIIDGSGADQLIGRGDMLITTGSDMLRLQCGFVDTPEVEEICEFVGQQRAYPSAFLLPEYIPEGGDSSGDFEMDEIDSMFVDSARIVVINQQGSASLLQRKLKLGYNRAGRIVDQLEAMGIIGSFQGSKAREVLFSDIESLDEFLKVKGLL
jgi:S-DNA-T family DNA segregation ATPase FtsK/SpoIIIE